jgi:hypothetical protein
MFLGIKRPYSLYLRHVGRSLYSEFPRKLFRRLYMQDPCELLSVWTAGIVGT